MMIEVLKSKIHCARVTEANLNYMGSITIDENLLDAANMIAGERCTLPTIIMASVLRPTLSKVNADQVKSA